MFEHIPGWLELTFPDISEEAYHTSLVINMLSRTYFGTFGAYFIHIRNKINGLNKKYLITINKW